MLLWDQWANSSTANGLVWNDLIGPAQLRCIFHSLRVLAVSLHLTISRSWNVYLVQHVWDCARVFTYQLLVYWQPEHKLIASLKILCGFSKTIKRMERDTSQPLCFFVRSLSRSLHSRTDIFPTWLGTLGSDKDDGNEIFQKKEYRFNYQIESSALA